jgi:hypothetical protein
MILFANIEISFKIKILLCFPCNFDFEQTVAKYMHSNELLNHEKQVLYLLEDMGA